MKSSTYNARKRAAAISGTPEQHARYWRQGWGVPKPRSTTIVPEQEPMPKPQPQSAPPKPRRPEPASVVTTPCCGFKFIHGVQNRFFDGNPFDEVRKGTFVYITPEQVISDVVKKMHTDGYGTMPAAFSFTDASSMEEGGKRLADYITDKGYGTVTATASSRNPNSGNNVTVYVWVLDHGKTHEWGGGHFK